MLHKPPQHRVDSAIVYVHPSDDAWDKLRIESEQSKMDDPSSHPVAQYLGGFTRYDLHAPSNLEGKVVCAADYIDESKSPCKWHLKRLSYSDWNEVHAMWYKSVVSQEIPMRAYEKSCRLGIKKVENGPDLTGPPGALTEKDMDTLFAYRTREMDLIYDIGQAVYQANMPLTEPEKKPSAS